MAVLAVVAAGAWGWQRFGPGFGGSGRAARPEQLNVLLITADTTRADYLGCYGRASARTPNMDRLARQGTRFTHCTTCVPFTLPAHASIMTGLYPFVHGARQNGTGRLSKANETLAEVLHESGLATQATIAGFVLNEEFGIAQGFEVYHEVADPGRGEPLDAERKGNVVCDDALAMLRSLAGKRFFLWVHFYDPHFPYESPRVRDPLSPAAYEDEVAFMDEQIGRLLAALSELKLERKTLIALVGDHGEGLGEHAELLHGKFLYDSTLRVPLILWCPGVIPAGQAIAAQVSVIDVAPTILDLTSCRALAHAQGVSLAPLVRGKAQDLGLAAYSESMDAYLEFGLSPLRSLSKGDWKYVLAPKAELYDHRADPGEMHNAVAEQAELAAQMREQLRQIIAEAPPPLPPDDVTVELSAADRARLESLGYVGSRTRATDEGGTELDRFEPRGGDPKDYAPLLKRRSEAIGAMRRGAYKEAEEAIRQLIEVFPKAPRLQVDLAEALSEQGRGDEAVEVCRRAIALDPTDNYALDRYGRVLLYARRWDEAVTHLEAQLKKTPHDVVLLHEMAVALAELGRMDQAEEHLRLGLSFAPQNPRLLHAMGFLRLRQGQRQEAIDYFRKALQVDPGFQLARQALQQLGQSVP